MCSSFCDDGKQMATYWFLPINHTIAVGLLESAFNDAIFLPSAIHTNFVISRKCRCNPSKFFAKNVLAFFFNLTNRSGSKIGLNLFIVILYHLELFVFQRSSCITFFTTATFTLRQVTDKLLFYHLVPYQ